MSGLRQFGLLGHRSDLDFSGHNTLERFSSWGIQEIMDLCIEGTCTRVSLSHNCERLSQKSQNHIPSEQADCRRIICSGGQKYWEGLGAHWWLWKTILLSQAHCVHSYAGPQPCCWGHYRQWPCWKLPITQFNEELDLMVIGSIVILIFHANEAWDFLRPSGLVQMKVRGLTSSSGLKWGSLRLGGTMSRPVKLDAENRVGLDYLPLCHPPNL